ncbi:MAG: DUF4340 domain-containing protein [Planctomycetaceae bacterium]|nr:DUF4340 domain-containing protein [Planctomycetaceae bacterium]
MKLTNDTLKTFLFFVLAFCALLPAIWLSRPEGETFTAEKMVEKVLFPELHDVMDVASLSLASVEKSGRIARLEVRKVNGQWILSSFSGYPANAQNRMVEVVSALSGLEVLRVVGEDAETRKKCGVLEPEDSQSAAPEERGDQIVIRNASGKVLLDLILGHETEDGSGKYYVRRGGQNPVYIVKMDPSKLSAKFIDWIERDLLKIQPSDIGSLFALDCQLDLHAQDQGTAFNHRGQFSIEQKYLEDPDWVLVSNLRMFGNGMRDMGMPTGMTLDLPMLRKVSQALADMRIASVQRKPEGILKAFRTPENIQLTQEQDLMLQKCGFCVLPMNLGNGVVNSLFSTDGQVHVYTKNGIVYRLFFGGIAGQEALEDLELGNGRKFYRYLILTADLYPQGIEQPKRMELPPAPPEDADEAVKAQYRAQNQALIEINAQEDRIYEEKLADARKRVEKMNELFADWYFIIPEDVYQQIHLTYANVFISTEEAEKRKREAEEKAETLEPETHSASQCTDPNCPHDHGETETPAAAETENAAETETHSASQCTDPNCPHDHGETETPAAAETPAAVKTGDAAETAGNGT